ncbi:sensor histidine kinase [Streptacidiphilus jiangxiensis]|uniref:histidine kinase n=1 Tax=Streptacidiphilus jiangxiensis TaxID=235985 RepID=A0A1H7Q2C5_STRJI|nr:HAMP domain-containing sensor histidine kinase [Streptacidiphilus jiangxiensis]SEL41844.1 two-component system, OmpR family, sensor histidine kinase PrrB [Streptacidiphilus jiangxiensis]
MKLSTRLALWVGLTVPLVVLALGALLIGLVTHDLRQQQNDRLRSQAAALKPDVQTVLSADLNGHPAVARTRNKQVLSAALDSGVIVFDRQGQQVLEGGPRPGAAVALPPPSGRPVSLPGFRAVGVSLDGRAAGGTLWVFSPDSSVSTQVATVRTNVLLAALLAAPLAGLLTLALARRATRSLRTLSGQAAALDPRDGADAFRHRRSGVTEVDELAGALGTVLARYDEQAARTGEALETARAFASAASHELRTPLMSMQTNLDVLAAHPDLPVGERAEVVTDLRVEHGRLLELLTALRTLARGDLVEADAFTEVDLGELVDSCVAAVGRARPEASWGFTGGYGVRVRAWEPGLKIMVTNLLTNAAVHGHLPGRPARVEVGMAVLGQDAVLTVDDRGPGIPPARRAEVFERFVRGADSPGSGLGLTLVAQQAALHGGSVSISDAPGGHGTRFTVRLPLSGTPFAEPTQRNWLTQTLQLRTVR